MPVPEIKRLLHVVVVLVGLAPLLGGCIQRMPRTVKIGLVAPFEGRYREIGYDVIPAARLAIREWAARKPDSDLIIELVAYDDGGNPVRAVEQAHRLVADPEVVIVIGHWREETTQAALTVYAEAGLPLITFSTQNLSLTSEVYNLAPSIGRLRAAARQANLTFDGEEDVIRSIERLSQLEPDSLLGGSAWGLSQFYYLAEGNAEGLYFASGFAEVKDMPWSQQQKASFIDGFKAGSLGAPPGYLSTASYEATWLAIKLIMTTYSGSIDGTPVDDFSFSLNGRRHGAPIYLYRWQDGQRVLIEVR